MEKHTCKLCSRRFTNGRALGGHMRSHVATTKQPPPQRIPSPPPSWSSSSEQEEDPSPHTGRGLYRLRENPKRSFKMVDPEFSSSFGNSSSMVVQDGDEVEMMSSSVSDITTTDEDVAFCLVMLSREAWSGKQTQQLVVGQEIEEEEEEEEEEEGEEYRSDDEIEGVGLRKAGRSRYQCGTCRKVFRSYQALGGHRASHKKVKHSHQHHQERENPRRDSIHECPFCFRVFPSGQALGGHKRSHLSSSAATATSGRGGNESFIDLNLPAPMEDCSASVSAV